MKIIKQPLSVTLIALAAMLNGCAPLTQRDSDATTKAKAEPVKPVKPPVVKPPVEPPPPAAPSADQLILNDGIALYNNGDYNGAIKRLNGAGEIWSGNNKPVQLMALKYMAFSYCVTSRKTLCRQQFDKALKLDRNFDLAPGEHGHPLWGPVFAKARKQVVK